MTHNQIQWMLGRQQAEASLRQAKSAEEQAAVSKRHEEGLWYHDKKTGQPVMSLAEKEYRYNTGAEDYKRAWDIIDRITGGVFAIASLF